MARFKLSLSNATLLGMGAIAIGAVYWVHYTQQKDRENMHQNVVKEREKARQLRGRAQSEQSKS